MDEIVSYLWDIKEDIKDQYYIEIMNKLKGISDMLSNDIPEPLSADSCDWEDVFMEYFALDAKFVEVHGNYVVGKFDNSLYDDDPAEPELRILVLKWNGSWNDGDYWDGDFTEVSETRLR